MDYIQHNEIIDDVLNSCRDHLAGDFGQYRNHVYRVYNLAIPFATSVRDMETLSIAAAFHDLGIWTNKTFDYLVPSIELAKQYAGSHHLPYETINEIVTIISEHHKVTKVKTSALAEIFRQADLVDLSLGFFSCGRKRGDIRRIRKAFPNQGFHFNLFRLFLRNLVKNPLNPLPMYKL